MWMRLPLLCILTIPPTTVITSGVSSATTITLPMAPNVQVFGAGLVTNSPKQTDRAFPYISWHVRHTVRHYAVITFLLAYNSGLFTASFSVVQNEVSACPKSLKTKQKLLSMFEYDHALFQRLISHSTKCYRRFLGYHLPYRSSPSFPSLAVTFRPHFYIR